MKKGDFIHFVGIGGVSMSGIAIELASQGFNVSGSDTALAENNFYLDEIQKFGQIRLFDGGHDASNIDPNVKYLVVTSTIHEANPEVIRARELGIIILQRFEIVNLLIKEYTHRIGIFGGAGKTTTTSLAFFLFQNAGLLPSLFLGSVMKNLMSSVHIDYKKDFCIFETDESDASFEQMNMNAGIFVTIEKDHLEHNAYSGCYDNMKLKFANLLTKLQNINAPICYNEDSIEIKEIISEYIPLYKNIKSFSIKNINADFYGTNFKFLYGGMSFNLYKKGEILKKNIFMPLIGDFNALNVIAGITMLSFYETDEKLYSSILRLRIFDGVDKRQCTVGKFKNFDIIDDYAHSPLKIKVMLDGFYKYTEAINSEFITICEIHKISRYKKMYDAFLTSFQSTKILVLMDIYRVAGHENEEINFSQFIQDIKKQNPKLEVFYSSNNELSKLLYQLTQRDIFKQKEHNFLLFLGAGVSTQIAKNMQKELEKLDLVN